MKKENISYVVMITGISIVLMILLVFINVNGPLSKAHNKTTTTQSTTITQPIVVQDYLENEKQDTINIEGETEEFTAKTYVSKLGFKVTYDIALFEGKIQDVNSVIFLYKEDAKNYIKVERMSEEEYYNEYANASQETIDQEGYLYTNHFYQSGNIYLKVIKCIINNSEYHGLSERMDYIINSLYVVS